MRSTACKITLLALLPLALLADWRQDMDDLCWSPPVSSAVSDVTNGIVCWYKFTDGSGSTITDNSGNSKNATTYNSPAWVSAVNGYGAMTFTRASSHYASIPTISCGTNYTMSVWIYENSASSVGYQGAITFRWTGESPTTYEASIEAVPSATKWGMVGFPVHGDYVQGAWHHYMVTHNGVVYSNYYDGALYYTAALGDAGVALTKISRTGVLGRYWNDSSAHYLDAKLADVRIYNRMLSAAEAAAVYAQTGHP